MRIKTKKNLIETATALFKSRPPAQAQKEAIEFSPKDWNAIYKSGRHKAMWDLDGPDPGAVMLTALFSHGPDAKLLDIGCGSGANAIHFAHHGYRVCAVDLGEEALAQARARAQDRCVINIEWIAGDIRQLELAGGDFDLAYDRGCLHSLPLAHWPAYAGSVHRLLKPKAPLFVYGCGLAESTYFAPLTHANLARFEPWFMVEILDEVRICAPDKHLRGSFALLRRRG